VKKTKPPPTKNQTPKKIVSISGQDFAGISAREWSKLYESALEVRENAHAPYSGFYVGASILTQEGDIISGCNVENATFGATVCAERTAIGNAVSMGFRRFKALCVITRLKEPAAPCGICRQVISEFCSDLPIMMANPQGECRFFTLDELLPCQFSGSDIN